MILTSCFHRWWDSWVCVSISWRAVRPSPCSSREPHHSLCCHARWGESATYSWACTTAGVVDRHRFCVQVKYSCSQRTKHHFVNECWHAQVELSVQGWNVRAWIWCLCLANIAELTTFHVHAHISFSTVQYTSTASPQGATCPHQFLHSAGHFIPQLVHRTVQHTISP